MRIMRIYNLTDPTLSGDESFRTGDGVWAFTTAQQAWEGSR